MNQGGRNYVRDLNITVAYARSHPAEFLRLAKVFAHDRLKAKRPTSRAPCIFVFKIVDIWVDAELLQQVISSVDAVILYRRANTTAQYLSYKHAVTTGCWAVTPEQQATRAECQQPRDTALHGDWPEFHRSADAWFARAAAFVGVRKPMIRMEMESYLQVRPWMEVLLQSAAAAGAPARRIAELVSSVYHASLPGACEKWCTGHSSHWILKCTWNHCESCGSCHGSLLFKQDHRA
eukprot:70613-Prymnesium_polylepis.1